MLSIFIQGPATRTEFLVQPFLSVQEFKQKLVFQTGVPIASQILRFNNFELNNDALSLAECGVSDSSTIHVSTSDKSLQSALESFTDDDSTSVPKFEMADADYALRQDSVRVLKQRMGLGQAKKTATIPKETEEVPEECAVGTRCEEVFSSRRGIVRFLGAIPELPVGTWVGVELDEPVSKGRGDGTVEGGRRLFECSKGRGSFFRPNKLRYGPQYINELDAELDLSD